MYTYIAFFKYVAISKYIWNIYTFSFSIQKWQEKKRYVFQITMLLKTGLYTHL